MKKVDFLIIGSGIAGLSLALKLAEIGEVVIMTKKDLQAGSSKLAQGGIAGVRNTKSDTFENHFKDTLKAGSYLNDKKAVKYLVENAPKALDFLEECGVEFDFELHREGGHSFPRISHVADETGRFIQAVLSQKVLDNPRILIKENCFAVDILKNDTCQGVSYFDGENHIIYASKVIIASGGAGQIYAKTTNPKVATGDGMAMCIRAGLSMRDLEFVQFHPTALDYPLSPLFLLTEAMRGEGAKLVNQDQERFVDELAPRDRVARAIFKQEKAYIDFIHEDQDVLKEKFPNIYKKLAELDMSLKNDLIPVTPASHFFCGGVVVDINGQTEMEDLYALGETACTGVHGANRLASNSLLEGVVFAEAIYQDIKKSRPKSFFGCDLVEFEPEADDDAELRVYLKNQMWEKAGLVRNMTDLKWLLNDLENKKAIGTETANLLDVSRVLLTSCINRKESLGCHYLEN
jgi:L-aspartate oxidase